MVLVSPVFSTQHMIFWSLTPLLIVTVRALSMEMVLMRLSAEACQPMMAARLLSRTIVTADRASR